ncbi:MAG TPA: HAMP domain-containing sensor histidine kinase [Candidatus Polarisedimenticolia bacterium]|jgi:signal transduction histidine kinase|nr:HAMP domain-containing sensor histidine kinase [Candidatus Polarisedimenticolia bacterium]
MSGILSALRRMDTALVIRHLAICLAAAASLLWPVTLRAGNAFLWLIGITALSNLALAILWDRPETSRLARYVSPLFGITSWALLSFQSGGAGSPFIAGFALETLLSAFTFVGWGTLLISSISIGCLWMQQSLLGFAGALRPLGLETGFLVLMGLVAFLLSSRWQRARNEFSLEKSELCARLSSLEQELERLHHVGNAGPDAARLAHSTKNAIYAMRGFVDLIQRRLGAGDTGNPALRGLQACIGQLEEVIRFTFGPRRDEADRPGATEGAQTLRVIDDVIREVSICYPEIRWSRQVQEPLPAINTTGAVLHEVLLNLVRNAAESMHGRGEVSLESLSLNGTLQIAVRDEGEGIDESELEAIFRPGYTTKPDGAGLGLFLARRAVESQGGFLKVAPRRRGGTEIFIGIPVRGH